MSANPYAACRSVETHEWKAIIHADGCHSYSTTYTCLACGATLVETCERSVTEDPWSDVWMVDMDVPFCDRCAELLAGAEPRSESHIEPRCA